MFPPEVLKAVAIYHLPTAGGSAQAYPGTADATITAAVLPLDRRDSALVGFDLIDPWEIYVEPGTDIRLQDKLIINGDTSNYYVKHIFKANFGGLAHQRVTIASNK